jgi:alkylated DNA repair dioxygenase AlkB
MTLPGLEKYAKPESPVTIIKEYVAFKDQGSLIKALQNGPWHTLSLRYGNVAKRKNIVFYEGDSEAAHAYTKAATDKERPIPYAEGPTELRELRKRLQDDYGFAFSLCYVNYYKDETTGIGWHNDAEEIGSKIPVRMVCLGGTRTFSIWKVRRDKDGKLQKPFAEWEELTESGDLVEMPVGFHEEDAYRHAVLPQRQFAAPRISLTFRSPDLSADGPWAPEPFPCEYDPNFLSGEESDALFRCLDAWPYAQRRNPRNRKTLLRRQGVAFVSDPTHVQIRFKRQGLVLIDDAPPEIRSLRDRLSTHIGRDVNYLSINKYPDGKTGIDWHNHAEDKGVDTPELLVSVGAARNFSVRPINCGMPGKAAAVLAKHGSLIVMPAAMNDTHQHAILPDRTTTVRYSVNAKCLVHTPRVWDCHAGKDYPKDAVYVGCRVSRGSRLIREGTIFGNGTDPLVSHDGWLKTEESFRRYAEQKMLDPAFRQQAAQLRGKHLLCWCVQDGPERAKFCHARVWLELINGNFGWTGE